MAAHETEQQRIGYERLDAISHVARCVDCKHSREGGQLA